MGMTSSLTKAAAKSAYSTPWLVTFGLAAGTEVAHLVVGHDPQLLAATVAMEAVSGVGLTGLTWKAVRKSSAVTRGLYTASTGAAALGVVSGTIGGLANEGIGLPWVLGSIGLSIAANLRTMIHRASQETKDQPTGKLDKLAERVDLEKYQVTHVQGTGNGIVTARIQGKHGATLEEFRAKLPALAAGLRLGAGRATLTVDPDDSSAGDLTMAVADLLREPIPWPGPDRPGASITEPITIGRYEDGQPETIILPATKGRVLEHLLVMGMSGSGKSEFFRTVAGTVLARRETALWVVDTSKGMQTLGPIRHGADWILTDPATARAFFKLMPSVIKARADHLGRRGLTDWQPGCGLTFIVLWMEEAADFAGSNEAYNKLLRAARSVGIWCVTSLQRASDKNLGSDARSNHGAAACFGVNSIGGFADASFVLPDSVLDAGASPYWGTSRPGRHYLVGMGAAEERWPIPARGYLTDAATLADRITAGAAFRSPLDEVTAAAAGALYANRARHTSPLLPGLVDTAPAPPPVVPSIPDNDDADDGIDLEDFGDMDEDEIAAAIEQAIEDCRRHFAAMDPEPDQDYAPQGLDTPIEIEEGQPVIEFGQGSRVPVEEARARLHARLGEWIGSGKVSFQPAELADLVAEVGRERTWLYREFTRLVDAEIIASDDAPGVWLILRSPVDGGQDGPDSDSPDITEGDDD